VLELELWVERREEGVGLETALGRMAADACGVIFTDR